MGFVVFTTVTERVAVFPVAAEDRGLPVRSGRGAETARPLLRATRLLESRGVLPRHSPSLARVNQESNPAFGSAASRPPGTIG
ncbi:MAG TPA: hypothetical protein VM618_03045, partial [Acidimicrobiia bacterium]|nr:hypothetical protein [Acidimicrobiia bacterium]